MAVLSGDVLVVNAGSTSVKLSLVAADERSRPVADLGGGEGAAAVGHRVVHGGDRFTEPVPIDDEIVDRLDELRSLAPLHMTPALDLIRDARRALPEVPHVAVFDTAFHHTIPPVASTYPLPARYRELGIHRFGFHGLAVASAAEQVPAPRLVVCHLGGGCSVTAVRDGASVDTTMGFTPLEGVPMATRAGSVDPGALLYLLRAGVTADELDHALEHESGLLALAGSGDVEQLLRMDSPEAELALAIFAYRVSQAVASMATALGGLDALAFTGGIGEHAASVRDAICDRVRFLGVDASNVHVVHAREDVMVARAVRRLIGPPAIGKAEGKATTRRANSG